MSDTRVSNADLLAHERFLAWAEEKGIVKRVRTAGGAALFKKPIGSLIVGRPNAPGFPGHRPAAEEGGWRQVTRGLWNDGNPHGVNVRRTPGGFWHAEDRDGHRIEGTTTKDRGESMRRAMQGFARPAPHLPTGPEAPMAIFALRGSGSRSVVPDDYVPPVAGIVPSPRTHFGQSWELERDVLAERLINDRSLINSAEWRAGAEDLEGAGDTRTERLDAVVRRALEMAEYQRLAASAATGPDSGPSVDVGKLLADNPQEPGESSFEYTARLVDGLPETTKDEVIFRVRERYEPVDYIATGMARYRAAHGLPEPKADIAEQRADPLKADLVARAFEAAPEEGDRPDVRAAFEAFKGENAAMWDFMTSPEPKGLGIKVDFVTPEEGGFVPGTGPYKSAAEQAEDLRQNHHISIEAGLGGAHELTMTQQEYDRFRAVHDTFGHAGVGRGFDRHGEYEAWLAHTTMYTGDAQLAMSSEYHGVNSALWSGEAGTPGTGKSVLLPPELTLSPWDEEGNLVRKQDPAGGDSIDELIAVLGLLEANWINHYERAPLDGGVPEPDEGDDVTDDDRLDQQKAALDALQGGETKVRHPHTGHVPHPGGGKHVRTPEGARLFKKPIGSPIVPGDYVRVPGMRSGMGGDKIRVDAVRPDGRLQVRVHTPETGVHTTLVDPAKAEKVDMTPDPEAGDKLAAAAPGDKVHLTLKGGGSDVKGTVVGPYEHPMNDMPATVVRRDDGQEIAVGHHTVARVENGPPPKRYTVASMSNDGTQFVNSKPLVVEAGSPQEAAKAFTDKRARRTGETMGTAIEREHAGSAAEAEPGLHVVQIPGDPSDPEDDGYQLRIRETPDADLGAPEPEPGWMRDPNTEPSVTDTGVMQGRVNEDHRTVGGGPAGVLNQSVYQDGTTGQWVHQSTLTTRHGSRDEALATADEQAANAPVLEPEPLDLGDGTPPVDADHPHGYSMAVDFTTDRPLTQDELDGIDGDAYVQASEPTDAEGEDLDVATMTSSNIVPTGDNSYRLNLGLATDRPLTDDEAQVIEGNVVAQVQEPRDPTDEYGSAGLDADVTLDRVEPLSPPIPSAESGPPPVDYSGEPPDPMTDSDAEQQLGDLIEGYEDVATPREVLTFADDGVMTNNNGLVVRYDNGAQFQLTIHQSRPAADDDPDAGPRSEQEMQDQLQGVLTGDGGDSAVWDNPSAGGVSVDTYEAQGVMTMNNGVVVSFPNGSEYQITIVLSRQADNDPTWRDTGGKAETP